MAALVAVALVVVGVVAAVTSRSSSSGRHPPGPNPTALATPATIKNVSVFHLERNADDAAGVTNAFDGNPDTAWSTDIYFGPHFAGLRHGLGLALTLDGRHKLHQLRVTSPTQGWSAEVYVADAIPNPPALAPWGSPVDSKQTIDGSATFNLAGKQGAYVLLWLTDLGPRHQARVAELNVS